ncbi:MAG: tRNA (adenosine(37)-N6)-threonylcarbamoyltransferase complex dimerization subunit type 1 TsaB [Candidatus Poribacteria bacterium]|nr:tRNA (adenosine(37)-N6)-threonylcarbamoyltransferase complex dimerization subunit type 1 TsaB [Candidatus Poribacteria bacterium]
MKILGIDTSTPIGSVALIDDDYIVAEHTLNIVQAHSSRLMPAIDTVLKWGEVTPDALDGCAVGIGPGSFTGIRIGVATVKSLCYAVDKPIVGVSTLEAIAYNLRWTDGFVCPILDARRSEIYGSVFHGGTEWQRLTDDLCLPVDAFLDELDNHISPDSIITFVGDGLASYGDAVRERFDKIESGLQTPPTSESVVHFADTIFNVPRGATIAKLGAQRLKQGDSDSYWTLVPNYVRIGLY